jgi:hypothetical protein
VPIISEVLNYNGFEAKVIRLGLDQLLSEALSTVSSFELLVKEEKYANGTRGIRQTIDEAFSTFDGWKKLTSGGIDWKKTNDRGATIGVEVQVSGRSDMLAVDIMHLKEEITDGSIDVGLIIVPDNALSRFLTDRTPNLATAIKHVEHRARDLPIQIAAFRHNGPVDALIKMRTNLGRL